MPKLREEAGRPDPHQTGFWAHRNERERCVACWDVVEKAEMLEVPRGRLCRPCCAYVTANVRPFPGALSGAASALLGAAGGAVAVETEDLGDAA